MKTQKDEVTHSQWRAVVNATVAFALAALVGSQLPNVRVIWDPGSVGEFGLTVERGSWRISDVVPGSPADKAGAHVGDVVDNALPMRERLILKDYLSPRPGERITISRPNGHTLTLRAVPFKPSRIDNALLALKVIGGIIFFLFGLVLVLFRPSRMTWGFYLLSLAAFDITVGTLPALGGDWFLLQNTTIDAISDVGVVGALVFCLRFPANAPTGWRHSLDRAAPLLAIALAAFSVYTDLAGIAFAGSERVLRLAQPVENLILLGIIILSCVILLATYLAARGLERQRIAWVVFGMICVGIAVAVDVVAYSGFFPLPGSAHAAFSVLYPVLPITVAYAVIRHRVIDVRFVISRSLAIGKIVVVVVLIVIAVDWLFSTRLPTSRFETATYFAIALLIGLSLNSGRQKISKTIDALFFRQWRRSEEQADAIADVIRRATSRTELQEPLTAAMKSAFALTSVALFERVEDGGFVRVAATGWPGGTIWHILPDDPLIRRADSRLRTVDIDSLQWRASDLPSGLARPAVMVPLVAARRVIAILLLGAHDNGTGLAQDELRLILRLVADACPAFATGSTDVVHGVAGTVRVAGT